MVKIGDKIIGEKKPCFIIAEAGVNHNGNLRLAKKIVEAAKKAGADAVKFQTFKSENLVTENAEMADYQKKNIREKESQLEMLKKLELKKEDFSELKKYCDKKNIIFLSTPHTEDALDFLEKLVPALKIASGDLTNIPFLEKVARKRKPIILSTGMATTNEVREAIKAIRKCGNNKIVLLHCTSNYPCHFSEVNLKAISTLKKEFKLPVGYSDHTQGILIPALAVVLGAKVIEKHFTLDKRLPGPDHRASLEPEELEEMVKTIRDTERALGSGVKGPTKSEEKIKKLVRKSIIARVDISENTKITKEMLIVKRPGIGIAPKYLSKVLNKKAKKGIKKDELISFEKLE